METRFRRHIKDYFRGHRLSREQLCQLERMQAGACARRTPLKLFRTPLAKVAIVMLVMGGAWLGWQQYHTAMQVDRLVAEIVYNHNKQMTMEIESNAIDSVKGYLTKLDFPLIATHRLPIDQWELMGGRYCSLQGKLAAQLKFRQRSSGEIYTLFQTACPPGVPATNAPSKAFVNGVEVQLWTERGLLVGMAGGR